MPWKMSGFSPAPELAPETAHQTIIPKQPATTPLAPPSPPKPKGPGVLGESFGMLTPEEARADLDARWADFNERSKRVNEIESLVGDNFSPQLNNARAALPDIDQLYGMEAGDLPLASKTALRSGVENVVKGAADTAIAVPEMVGIVKGYLGGKVDDDALLKWSLGAKEWVAGQFPGDAARQSDFSQQLASGLGQIATFYGAGAAAAAMKAGPKLTAALVAYLGGSATGSQGFEEATRELNAAKAEAAQRGDVAAITEYDRLLKTIGYTGLGLTEAVPIARTLSRATPPTTSLGHRIGQTAEGALEEALQEAGSQLGQNVVSQQTTDPDRKTFEGVADSATVGGVLGGLMGAALPGKFRAPGEQDAQPSQPGSGTPSPSGESAPTPESRAFTTGIEATPPEILRSVETPRGTLSFADLVPATRNSGVAPRRDMATAPDFAALTRTELAPDEYFHGGTYKAGDPVSGVLYLSKNPTFANSYVSMAQDRGIEGAQLSRVSVPLQKAAPPQLVERLAQAAGIETDYITPASWFDSQLHGVEPVRQLTESLRNAGFDHAVLEDLPYATDAEAGPVTVAFPRTTPAQPSTLRRAAAPTATPSTAQPSLFRRGVNQLRAPITLPATLPPGVAPKQARLLLDSGRAVSLPPENASTVYAAARAVGPMIPANVPVMTLTKVESLNRNQVRAHFAAEDGTAKTITLSPDQLFSARAFVDTDGAGRSTMHFTRFDSAQSSDSRLVGELWHETVHALRRQNLLWGADWTRLLGHAETLQIGNTDFRDFLRAIKSPKWEEAESGVSISELYNYLLAEEFANDPSGLADAVAEEAVAHMLELAQHGAVDLSAVQDIVDRIAAGALQPNPTAIPRTGPVFWAKDPVQEAIDMPETELDDLLDDGPSEDEWATVAEKAKTAKAALAQPGMVSTMEDYGDLIAQLPLEKDDIDYLHNIVASWEEHNPLDPPHWVEQAGAAELWKTDVIGAALKATQKYAQEMGSSNVDAANKALEEAVAAKAKLTEKPQQSGPITVGKASFIPTTVEKFTSAAQATGNSNKVPKNIAKIGTIETQVGIGGWAVQFDNGENAYINFPGFNTFKLDKSDGIVSEVGPVVDDIIGAVKAGLDQTAPAKYDPSKVSYTPKTMSWVLQHASNIYHGIQATLLTHKLKNADVNIVGYTNSGLPNDVIGAMVFAVDSNGGSHKFIFDIDGKAPGYQTTAELFAGSQAAKKKPAASAKPITHGPDKPAFDIDKWNAMKSSKMFPVKVGDVKFYSPITLTEFINQMKAQKKFDDSENTKNWLKQIHQIAIAIIDSKNSGYVVKYKDGDQEYYSFPKYEPYKLKKGELPFGPEKNTQLVDAAQMGFAAMGDVTSHDGALIESPALDIPNPQVKPPQPAEDKTAFEKGKADIAEWLESLPEDMQPWFKSFIEYSKYGKDWGSVIANDMAMTIVPVTIKDYGFVDLWKKNPVKAFIEAYLADFNYQYGYDASDTDNVVEEEFKQFYPDAYKKYLIMKPLIKAMGLPKVGSTLADLDAFLKTLKPDTADWISQVIGDKGKDYNGYLKEFGLEEQFKTDPLAATAAAVDAFHQKFLGGKTGSDLAIHAVDPITQAKLAPSFKGKGGSVAPAAPQSSTPEDLYKFLKEMDLKHGKKSSVDMLVDFADGNMKTKDHFVEKWHDSTIPYWVEKFGVVDLWKKDPIQGLIETTLSYFKKYPPENSVLEAQVMQMLAEAPSYKSGSAPTAPAAPPAPTGPLISTVADVLAFYEAVNNDPAIPQDIKNALSYKIDYSQLTRIEWKPYFIHSNYAELWKTDPIQALINTAAWHAPNFAPNESPEVQEALELIQTKAAKFKSGAPKILPAKYTIIADAIKAISEDYAEILPNLADRLVNLASPKNLWLEAPEFMTVGNELAAFAQVIDGQLKGMGHDPNFPADEYLEQLALEKLHYDLHEKSKPTYGSPADAIKSAKKEIKQLAKKNGGFTSKEFLEAWAPEAMELFEATEHLTPGEGSWAVAHAINNFLEQNATNEEATGQEVIDLLAGFLPKKVEFAPPTAYALRKGAGNVPQDWDLNPENYDPPKWQTVAQARPHISKFARNILDEILNNAKFSKKYAKGLGEGRQRDIAIMRGYAEANKDNLSKSVYQQLLDVAAGLQPALKAAPAPSEEPTAPEVPVPSLLTNDFTKRTFTFSGKGAGGSKPKEVWTDEFGKEYLFKPVQPGKKYLADAEIFGGKIAQLVNPTLSPAIFPMTLNDRYGSLQQFLPAEGDLADQPVEKMSWSDISALMRHHVVDYLISNHDGHSKQFLRSPDGIIGIDKGQAFKYFGKDKLALDYHPNQAYGEQEPIYNKLWRAFRDGKLDKVVAEAAGEDFSKLAPAKARIDEIDQELKAIKEKEKKYAKERNEIIDELNTNSPFSDANTKIKVSQEYIKNMSEFLERVNQAIESPFTSEESMPTNVREMIEGDTAEDLSLLFEQYMDDVLSHLEGTPYSDYYIELAGNPLFMEEAENSFHRAITDIVVKHLGPNPQSNKFTNAKLFTEAGSAKTQYLDGTWLQKSIQKKLQEEIIAKKFGSAAVIDPNHAQTLKDEKSHLSQQLSVIDKAKDTAFFQPVMDAIHDVNTKLPDELFLQLLEPYAKGRFKDPVRREAFLGYALYRKNHLGSKFWKFFLEITDPRRRAKDGAVTGNSSSIDQDIKNDPNYSKVELSDLERSAIANYSGSSYKSLNDALKLKYGGAVQPDGTVNLEYLKQAASGEVLARALKKLPAYTGPAYRGQDGSHDLAQFKAGKLWTSKGFLSTSYDPQKKFGGNIQFVIDSLTGRNIESYSQHSHEKEILFMPETEFLITSVIVTPQDYGNPIYTINMTEVPQIDFNELGD